MKLKKTLDDWCDYVGDGSGSTKTGGLIVAHGAAARCDSTQKVNYAVEYARVDERNDRRRIEMEMEEAGIAKPYRGEKLIAR